MVMAVLVGVAVSRRSAPLPSHMQTISQYRPLLSLKFTQTITQSIDRSHVTLIVARGGRGLVGTCDGSSLTNNSPRWDAGSLSSLLIKVERARSKQTMVCATAPPTLPPLHDAVSFCQCEDQTLSMYPSLPPFSPSSTPPRSTPSQQASTGGWCTRWVGWCLTSRGKVTPARTVLREGRCERGVDRGPRAPHGDGRSSPPYRSPRTQHQGAATQGQGCNAHQGSGEQPRWKARQAQSRAPAREGSNRSIGTCYHWSCLVRGRRPRHQRVYPKALVLFRRRCVTPSLHPSSLSLSRMVAFCLPCPLARRGTKRTHASQLNPQDVQMIRHHRPCPYSHPTTNHQRWYSPQRRASST